MDNGNCSGAKGHAANMVQYITIALFPGFRLHAVEKSQKLEKKLTKSILCMVSIGHL